MPQPPKTFDRADLVRFFHDSGYHATVGRFKTIRPSRTLFGKTETNHHNVEAETVGLWCEAYKFAIVIQSVRLPDGGFAALSPDSPLRQERKVTIRYGDGGSSAQLVRWVGNLADEFREEIRAAVPTQPIGLTGPAEGPLISQILAAATAALSEPEPDPEPEQPDAGDEDHRGTGTTIDDILSGREDDPE